MTQERRRTRIHASLVAFRLGGKMTGLLLYRTGELTYFHMGESV